MERAKNDNHAHKSSAQNKIRIVGYQVLNLEQSEMLIIFLAPCQECQFSRHIIIFVVVNGQT